MKILKTLIFSMAALAVFLPPPSAWSAPSRAPIGAVNLNTATPAELERLPGIGPAKAAQIVAYRQKQPFQSVEDLKKIRGLGGKRIEALRPHVSFIGPGTAKPSGPPHAETQPTLNALP